MYNDTTNIRICICNGITEYDIIDAIKKKNARVEEDIQRITMAGTRCGRCRKRVREILDRELKLMILEQDA